jgi:F-type H+-transporting ATPase subunit gamma
VPHAANLKQIKNRMTIVKSIGKITKTMKMVASARLKQAQKSMEDSRPFANSATKLVSSLPFFEEGSKKKHLILVITSDRGLCGSINSVAVKTTRALAQSSLDKGFDVDVASLGEKGTPQFNRFLPQHLIFSCYDISKSHFNFETVGFLVDKAFTENYDQISLVYSKFISLLSSLPTVVNFNSAPYLLERLDKDRAKFLVAYEFEEGESESHFRDLMQFHLASLMYNAFLENQTSELGARMNSMDNASKNASGMLKRLTIAYNRGRQAAITTELIEIISGAEAL